MKAQCRSLFKNAIYTSIGLLLTVPASKSEVKVYFGNLHAHSNLSDGNTSITPKEAYRIARVEGGLDFLCLSEHNHYLTDEEMTQLKKAASQATKNTFVALYGQEYSTINSGFNHSNIINYPVRIPETLNGLYKTVYHDVLLQWVIQHPDQVIVAGFNHPEDITTDYGMQSDYSGNWSTFVADMDPIVQLITVCNGPADADKKEFIPIASERFLHREISKSRWFEYLSHGMHLAPVVDHDTHSPTYGFRVSGRTAVWIDGNFNLVNLLKALSKMHCYATEDKNLKIIPSVNAQYLPGDILEELNGSPLNISLILSDSDEPNAAYKIEVYSGLSKSGVPASKVDALTSTLSGNGNVSLSIETEQGISSYYIIHIEQTSPDPINASAKADAWLAPIWVEGLSSDDSEVNSAQYASSKNSQVYHFINCSVVDQILPSNLQHHDSPPVGKRLHQGCPL